MPQAHEPDLAAKLAPSSASVASVASIAPTAATAATAPISTAVKAAPSAALTQPTANAWAPGTLLRVDLQLCRSVRRGSWTAELSVPGITGRLSFPSLRALGLYIARLETDAQGASARPRPEDAPPPA